ncbi:alpha-S1-casein [Vulpes vulpes]|uniref:Alpha-S1-casein n=1 Tax=Vulpes vulpes TaxID=9627 RepID=A0ABM4ZAN4_VULVU
MEDPEQRQSSSSSSSEEVVPNNTEQRQIPREDILSQRYLEQLRRLSQYNQLQAAIHDQQQLRRVNENNLLQLQQLRRMNENNLLQLVIFCLINCTVIIS